MTTPTTYRVTRFYFDESHPDHRKVVKRGLTLEEAKAWCNDPDTSLQDNLGRTVWFDGFQEES